MAGATVTDVERPDRDLANLHPDLVAAWRTIEGTMRQLGSPMKIVEGRRTTARQRWLYEQGRSRPGKIVTWAKPGTGKHEPGPDGLGWALDAAFEGPEPYAEQHPWDTYGRLAKYNGLVWGGDWKRPDRPHIQLA